MNCTFESRWKGQLTAFVRFKRGLGQPYLRASAALRSFDRFAASYQGRRSHELAPVLTNWLSQYSHRKPITIAGYVSTIRTFCQFRRRYDCGAFVPDRSWTPHSVRSNFLPHIFTPTEIQKILAATAGIRGSPRNRRYYRLLFVVLYCTGLRLGEALGIRRRDLDLNHGCFRVGPSKGRIRWVPFHRDLAREIRAWLEEDCTAYTSPDAFVFARNDGKKCRVDTASYNLRVLFRRCGLKPAKGRTGPRCHDTRHTMAVHCLQRWYREGRDLNRMLPWLSAYLGHRNLLGTERYLRASPELLAIAAQRLKRQLCRTNVSL